MEPFQNEQEPVVESEQSPPGQEITNPLGMGVCSVDEIVDRVRAFRQMNSGSIRQRFILSREDIPDPENDKNFLLSRGDEIDLNQAKNLVKLLPPGYFIKTYQPDEGITIISDSLSQEGASLTMEIYNRIYGLGGGKYEAFIDVVDSFSEFLRLVQKALFPRLILVGSISADRLEMEHVHFIRAKKFDEFFRIMEVSDSRWKPAGFFSRIKQVKIPPSQATGRDKKKESAIVVPPMEYDEFQRSVIREYTKPYFFE